LATCFCVFPWQTDRMRTTLSSYALVGIDAVPVDVIAESDQVNVVARRNRREFHSVRQPAPGAGTTPTGSPAQGTPRKLAPARIIVELS
jgi:hypothetical protein